MLTEETFNSILTQGDENLNSRPLTYVPENGLSYQQFTPNNFLIDWPHKSLPLLLWIKKVYNKDWKKCFTLSQQFWTRLLRESIPTMARRPKWIKDQRPLLCWSPCMDIRGHDSTRHLARRYCGKVAQQQWWKCYIVQNQNWVRKTNKTSKQVGTINWWLGNRPQLHSKTITKQLNKQLPHSQHSTNH